MNHIVPGLIPALLMDPQVSLFRTEDRVFEAMAEGWKAEMLARGLGVSTIKDRLGLIARFQNFTNDYPWNWGPADFNEFSAERRSGPKPLALGTLPTDANAVAMFCAYVTESGCAASERRRAVSRGHSKRRLLPVRA